MSDIGAMSGISAMSENHKANPRVLVFDSGVGGLSILGEIQSRVPGCDLIYASDNAAFPYGTKTEDELVNRVDRVLHQILAQHPVDIIVVACNSASTLALPHIRAHFDQPIVGVVPAIKPAAACSQTKVIGLLATPGTLSRSYTRGLIAEFANDCHLIQLGSSDLVQLAEQKLRGQPPGTEQLHQILAPMTEDSRYPDMDKLVLACTHFPLLREELSHYFGRAVQLVDSGPAIARRVAYWVAQLALKPGATGHHHLALFTEHNQAVAQLALALSRYDLNRIELVQSPSSSSTGI